MKKISMEISAKLLDRIDEVVESPAGCYANREEFIRDAVRCRIHQLTEHVVE